MVMNSENLERGTKDNGAGPHPGDAVSFFLLASAVIITVVTLVTAAVIGAS